MYVLYVYIYIYIYTHITGVARSACVSLRELRCRDAPRRVAERMPRRQ